MADVVTKRRAHPSKAMFERGLFGGFIHGLVREIFEQLGDSGSLSPDKKKSLVEKAPEDHLAEQRKVSTVFVEIRNLDDALLKGDLDKDRTGNMIPIISSMNFQRGNRHISYYKNSDIGKQFCKLINDIIPDDDLYESIVEYDKKPTIKNNEK